MDAPQEITPSCRLALVSLARSSNLNPPLGLVDIASYIQREQPDVMVSILDRNFDDVEQRILSEDFDVIGISAMTVDYSAATALARRIREQTGTPILLGGVHISTLPKSLDPIFDTAILGEGELTLTEWVGAFLAHGGAMPPADVLREIEGLAFFDDSKLVVTKHRGLLSLDAAPLSDWTLLKPEYFEKRRLDELGSLARGASLMTSRGCPYHCAFCSTTVFWGKQVRVYPVAHVIEEICRLVESYAITHVMIWDDLFTIHKKRLREFIEKLEEVGLLGKISFSCDSRANLFDEETCVLLKRMGLKAVFFGFESGCEKTLRFLKQPTVTVAENRVAISRGVRHGFKVQGAVIFASPDETLDEMRETVDFITWAAKEGAYRINSSMLVPFPGTEVWDIAIERGVISEPVDWGQFSLVNQDTCRPFLLDPSIETKDYMRLFRGFRLWTARQRFNFRILKAYARNAPFALLMYGAKSLFARLRFSAKQGKTAD